MSDEHSCIVGAILAVALVELLSYGTYILPVIIQTCIVKQ